MNERRRSDNSILPPDDIFIVIYNQLKLSNFEQFTIESRKYKGKNSYKLRHETLVRSLFNIFFLSIQKYRDFLTYFIEESEASSSSSSFFREEESTLPPRPPKTHPGIIFDIKPGKSLRKSRLSTAQDKHGLPSSTPRG